MATHAFCDDKFCIKQASEKRTVKGKDEIVFKNGRKFVCNIPVDYWANALNGRVAAKRREVNAIKADIKGVESSCIARFGEDERGLESLDVEPHMSELRQPNVPHKMLIHPQNRLPGAIFANPQLEGCLAQRVRFYPSLLASVNAEIKLQTEAKRYEDNVLMAKLDELDLPGVEKRKVKVIINPKTRRTQFPRVELGRQKLKLFRENVSELPQCAKKLGV